MKTKLLIFGITLMVTSLMQAAIYKVTNASNNVINIDFKEVSQKKPVALLERLQPKETVSINKGSSNIDTFVIFYPHLGGRFEVKNDALQANPKETVNIEVNDSGYCTIKRGKQITKTRGIAKAHYIH